MFMVFKFPCIVNARHILFLTDINSIEKNDVRFVSIEKKMQLRTGVFVFIYTILIYYAYGSS